MENHRPILIKTPLLQLGRSDKIPEVATNSSQARRIKVVRSACYKRSDGHLSSVEDKDLRL